ncbi:DUF397 domain-containing protein [Streptomyces kasugaensis]|uniref:DUF397 domain-containing protein n=1 Tax=Streptomyces kasugaensis TaxID=1946 RepID=A0A4Q9HM33_STRKA|nr:MULTISPECIES: DUF397 domain-containing protein [Streptomyces]MYU51004.1 DUF397 domain-containing protein [Streptomyces sp. SID7805]TBO55635.1 DUF397 domain-containing protein [Streptomyces kasugaensis]
MRSRDIVTEFVKASASQGIDQECVEVAHTADGGRAVRDSKDRDGGTQFHTPAAWAAFVDGVKVGAFEAL